MKKYLRNKVDGTLYGWDEILSKNPKCEEVTEEEEFPERFVKPEVVKKVQRNRKKKRTKLDLATEDVPEAPEKENPELSADASRKLP